MYGRKRGFTLIELLVVISIIALLLAILVPALRKAKELALDVICRQNLKQWAYAAKMYTQDNDDSFQEGYRGAAAGSNWWQNAWRPYYDDLDEIRCCPTAQRWRINLDGTQGPGYDKAPFAAWGHILNWPPFKPTDYGSYGINAWVENRPAEWGSGDPDPRRWRVASVGEPYTIPLMTDMQWIDAWVDHGDPPPRSETYDYWTEGDNGHFVRVVQNRHDESQNAVFLDWSVRGVGLKELWTLKWHREYDTRGPYTLAGGVTRSDWPDWMQGMEDF